MATGVAKSQGCPELNPPNRTALSLVESTDVSNLLSRFFEKIIDMPVGLGLPPGLCLDSVPDLNRRGGADVRVQIPSTVNLPGMRAGGQKR
jgi:hypothetical protein